MHLGCGSVIGYYTKVAILALQSYNDSFDKLTLAGHFYIVRA